MSRSFSHIRSGAEGEKKEAATAEAQKREKRKQLATRLAETEEETAGGGGEEAVEKGERRLAKKLKLDPNQSCFEKYKIYAVKW